MNLEIGDFMCYLQVENLCKNFNKNKVLNNINFSINKGEFVSILGPSGCGKTTLLRIIAGLEPICSGKIYNEGKDITNVESSNRAFSMVFQDYVLFPNMTVEENIRCVLEGKKLSRQAINEKLEYVLKLTELYELKRSYPDNLSGGQQQRVALARAIVINPKLLLLDECLSALDNVTKHKLQREIKNIQRKLNLTVLMITHNKEEALVMSDRIIIMNKWGIMQQGTPQDIYDNPKNKFTASFVGDINFLNIKDKMYGVRPENIDYSLEEKEEYIKSTITGIEFRGCFYRIYVSNNIDKNIFLDILNVKYNNSQFIIGGNIFIKFSKKILI